MNGQGLLSPLDDDLYRLTPAEEAAIHQHEREVEDLVRRHSAVAWTRLICGELRSNKLQGRLPVPHYGLRIIETACRFERGHRDSVLSQKDVRAILRNYSRVFRVINDFRDPIQARALEDQGDVNLWAQIASFQQLKFQLAESRQRFVFGRSCRLMRSPKMADAWRIMTKSTDLTPFVWLALLYGALGQADEHRTHIDISGYGEHIPSLTDRAYGAFVRASSSTPSEIKASYSNVRERIVNPIFWSTIRSRFWDTPFLHAGKNRLLAPWPSLILMHAQYGLDGMLSGDERGMWLHRFGKAFQEYVREELVECFGDDSVRPLDGHKRLPKGRVADFVVDNPKYRIYVEVKTARDLRPAFLPRELSSLTTTQRARDAVEQIRECGERDAEIGIVLGLEPSRKPLYGMAVFPEDMVGCNTPWFWNHALKLPRTDSAGRDAGGVLEFPPQIVSVDLLEVLNNVLGRDGVEFETLLREQQPNDISMAHGEWQRELTLKYNGVSKPSRLSAAAIDELVDEYEEHASNG